MKTRKFFVGAGVALVLVASTTATPRMPETVARPDLLRKLVDCRALTDPVARLACYDERVAALDVAETKQDIVVIDRAGMREARKTLFGLSLPSFKLLGGSSGGKKEEVSEIETTVASADYVGDHWAFVLADGARWVQTDQSMIAAPKPGQPIHIRQGAMGSYLANVNKQVAIRVRRVN